MAIAIVGTPAYQHYNSFVENSHTLSVTVPSGATLLLVGVTINNDNWGQLTSITVNGSAPTSAGSPTGAIANRQARWYYVINPTSGTYNVVANYSTSSNNAGGMLAVCLSGTDTSTPISDYQNTSTTSPSSPLNTSVTTPSGGWALIAGHADTAQPSPVSGQTTLGTNEQNHSFSYLLDATAMGHTFTGTPQITQAVVVVKAGIVDQISGSATLGAVSGSGSLSSTASGFSAGATLGAVSGGGSLTSSATTGTYTSSVLTRNNGDDVASATLTWVGFRVKSTGAPVLLKTTVSVTGGQFVVNDAALTPGATIRADWLESTGHQGWDEQVIV